MLVGFYHRTQWYMCILLVPSFDFEMMYFDLVGLVLVKSGERTAGPSNVNGQKKLGKKVGDHLVEVAWLPWPSSLRRCGGAEVRRSKSRKMFCVCLRFNVFSCWWWEGMMMARYILRQSSGQLELHSWPSSLCSDICFCFSNSPLHHMAMSAWKLWMSLFYTYYHIIHIIRLDTSAVTHD